MLAWLQVTNRRKLSLWLRMATITTINWQYKFIVFELAYEKVTYLITRALLG